MIMTVKQRKCVGGFTLIEVMAAVLIVTIVIAGGSFLFVAGRGQVALQKQYRAAAQLASQKLEELKAGTYASIAVGTTTDTNSPVLEGVSYGRSVNVVNAGLYKHVTVTVSWLQGTGHNSRNVTMVTCIAP
jgi:prepilin-type N-terminal cleavage/methylation domain-containing protein